MKKYLDNRIAQKAWSGPSCKTLALITTISIQALSLADTTEARELSEPETSTSSGRGGESRLDEIIVTAQKRYERIQDVPIAMNAYSREMLARTASVSIADVGRFAPNVRLNHSGTNPTFASYFIRGAGQAGTLPSTDPAVTTFVDGVPRGGGAGSFMELFDQEAVEVLRGPQGTLFGRNVTGGAVLVRSRRPTSDFEGSVEAGLGSFGSVWGGAVANGQISNKVDGRLAVYRKHYGGYFKNISIPGRRSGQHDVTLIRPSISVKPNSDLSIVITGLHYRDIGDGQTAKSFFAPNAAAYLPPYEAVPAPGKYQLSENRPGLARLTTTELTGEINWDIDTGTITSISSWRRLRQSDDAEPDGVPFTVFQFNSGLKQEQVYQEVRYSGDPFNSDFLDITVGAMYFHQKYDYREGRNLFVPPTGNLDTLGFTLAALGQVKHDQYGIFAQADARLTESITLTLGGRYSEEKKNAFASSLGNCTYDLSNCPIDQRGKASFNSFTPKIGLAWRPVEDVMLFASWTRGFRSGGFNLRNPSPAASFGPYGDEEVDAYEVGMKADLFDRRLRINIALFENKYRGLQATVLDPQQFGTIQNAADARVRGGELDFIINPIAAFKVRGALGYTDAKYLSFDNLDLTGDGIPDPGLATALKFPYTPKWSYSIGASYDMPAGDWGNIEFSVDYSYLAGHYTDVANVLRLDSYGLLSTNINLSGIDEQWSVSAFVKNITNKFYGVGGSRNPLYFAINPGLPRHFGVQASWKF